MDNITQSNEFREIVNDFKNKYYDKALNRLNKLLIIYPNEYFVIKLFASIYLKKTDFKNALKYNEKLLLFNKENFKKLTLGGCIFFKKDNNLCLKVEKF